MNCQDRSSLPKPIGDESSPHERRSLCTCVGIDAQGRRASHRRHSIANRTSKPQLALPGDHLKEGAIRRKQRQRVGVWQAVRHRHLGKVVGLGRVKGLERILHGEPPRLRPTPERTLIGQKAAKPKTHTPAEWPKSAGLNIIAQNSYTNTPTIGVHCPKAIQTTASSPTLALLEAAGQETRLRCLLISDVPGSVIKPLELGWAKGP